MESNFWFEKWKTNEIGFHINQPNPLLIRHFKRVTLKKKERVFLPLCGKTKDIAWLLANGFRVAGAELVGTAIEQLFAELEINPDISATGDLTRYSAQQIDIFVGDIFNLTADVLGRIDAVYDRAALVALPEDVRNRYAAHLMEITQQAPQLLIGYEYDQTIIPGPPFSVTPEEVMRHYGNHYQLTLLESLPVTGGLKGQCEASESVWLLEHS